MSQTRLRMPLLLAILLGPAGAAADTVVATRTIRALEIIGQGDVRLLPDPTPGSARRLDQVIGLEARVMLYPDRPIRPEQLAPPARIARNQLVLLLFTSGGLMIEAEGRALDRAAVGETVRVLNLGSRRTVRGTVRQDGRVEVGSQDG